MTTYSLATTHDDPQTMYAGTTDGVWKTTDEAQTWTRLEGIDGRVTAVSMDPENADVVVAATEPGAVHRSTDAGANWQRQNSHRQLLEEPWNRSSTYCRPSAAPP